MLYKDPEGAKKFRLLQDFDQFAQYNMYFLSRAFHKDVRLKLFKAAPVTKVRTEKMLLFLHQNESELSIIFNEKIELLLSQNMTDVKLINYFSRISADETFLEDVTFQEFSRTFYSWRKKIEVFFNLIYKIDFYALSFGEAFERKIDAKNRKMVAKRINAKRIAVMAMLRFLVVGAHLFVWVKDSFLVGNIIPFATLLLGFPAGALLKAVEILQFIAMRKLPTNFILPFCQNLCKKIEKRFLMGQLQELNKKLKELNLFFTEMTQLLEGFFEEYVLLTKQSSANLVAENRVKLKMYTVVNYMLNSDKFSHEEMYALLEKTSETGQGEVLEGSWIVYNDENVTKN